MEKIKDIIKNNKCVELLKLILISFICIYSFLSVINTLELIKEYNEINETIKYAEECFEQDLKNIEDDIVYTNIKVPQEEQSTHKMSYFQTKYPNAIYVLTERGGLIGDLSDILKKSVCIGIFIGLSIFIYKNVSKISILILSYIFMYLSTWFLLWNFKLFPVVELQIDKCGYEFSSAYITFFDELMIIFCFILTAFIILKIIKNKILINKLNELVKNDK